MKCSWQTFLSPLKGQYQYQALLGLFQTTRLTGGFDFHMHRMVGAYHKSLIDLLSIGFLENKKGLDSSVFTFRENH